MQPCPINIVIHKVKVCLCNDHIFLKKTNQLNHIIDKLSSLSCAISRLHWEALPSAGVVIDFSKTSVSLPIWACMPTIAAVWLIFGEVEEKCMTKDHCMT